MGQFKPMVKMMTTEPTVELKLKNGGKVQKKADGGMMMPPPPAAPPAPASMPGPMPSRMPPRSGPPMGLPGGAGPMRPSLSARRRAMKGMPSGAGPAAPVGPMSAMMKKGGSTKHEDVAEDRAMIKKAMAGKKFATGGVVDGQGGYATGGVVNGNGGGYATGGVAKGNGGGYKKGGAPKKAYAAGGTVDSGSPVAMKQGSKPVPKPISITALTGAYKHGGRVKMKEGGDIDLSKGAYDRTIDEPPFGMSFAKKAHSFIDSLFAPKKEAGAGRGFINPPSGSVTKSKEAVTVVPKKSGGAMKC